MIGGNPGIAEVTQRRVKRFHSSLDQKFYPSNFTRLCDFGARVKFQSIKMKFHPTVLSDESMGKTVFYPSNFTRLCLCDRRRSTFSITNLCSR